MEQKVKAQATEKALPVPQNSKEQTSEMKHAPLPIGCAPLDEEQQRMWDEFCKEGKERDRQREEARQQRMKAKQETTTQAQQQPQQAKVAKPILSPMEMFKERISYRTAPKYKKINLSPSTIAEYLRVAYINECSIRHTTAIMDNGTTSAIDNVARWLSAETNTKGSLIMRGYIGVGKTTMMRAICTLFTGIGIGGFKIISAFELAELSKDREAFGQLKNADYLGIDDLGQEPNTIKDYGNERSPFEELISARYDRLKQTVISTNLVVVGDKDQITERYGSRVADRLREMCNTINYDPNLNSYRK